MDAVLAIDDFSEAGIESVYMGGGTASLMTNPQIREFLHRLRDGFGLGDAAEVTLESEPGTKSSDDFVELLDAGVNRVSIGVQAFQDHHLKELNRSHTSAQALRMIEGAQQAGVENLHIDLMFGLPGQTLAEWKESVDIAGALGLQHVSTYQMILFPGEALSRKILHGELPEQPEPDVVTEMRSYAEQVFEGQGMARYSLTEFAQPGRSCRYVRATWDGSDYLGLGPAAYSRRGSWLWENSVVHQTYQRQVSSGGRGAGKTVQMTPSEMMARDLAMGLCLMSLDLDEVADRCGQSLEEFEPKISHLEGLGLVSRTGSDLALTEKGVRYATHVMKVFTSD
jgi:oxygen-independent coproporphyrinogen-3 oxidase